METNFFKECDLYLKIVSIRDSLIGMYRHALIEFETAKDQLDKQMPKSSKELVDNLAGQLLMYEADIQIVTNMYNVIVHQLSPELVKRMEAIQNEVRLEKTAEDVE
jgi:hypothetical protein